MVTSSPSPSDLHTVKKKSFVLALLTVLFLIPFVQKAFHIDDPVYVWIAQQIHEKPIDFFGFEKNWGWNDLPVSVFNQNPPGVSYFIAFAALFVGWSEVGLHLAFILPAIGAILGTYRLATWMCPHPFWAASLTLLTPVFLISSTLMMCETLLLCTWVWAVVFWIEAFDSDRHWLHWIAGLLMSIAVLTKFPGINLVPLLFVYALVRSRKIGRWCFPLLLPIVTLACYEWYTDSMYGTSAFSNAIAYTTGHNELSDRSPVRQGLISIIFTGGCYLPILFLQPWLWGRVRLILLFILIAICVLVVSQLLPSLSPQMTQNRPLGINVQKAIHLVSGLTILVLCFDDFYKNRDCQSLLLVLWILGVFTFAWIINWTVNGRTLLPMAPAVSILIVRRIAAEKGLFTLNSRWLLRLAMVGMAAVGLLAASADYLLANSARTAAFEIVNRYRQPGRTIWFLGHWGFQYYAEIAGAKAYDYKTTRLLPGDVLVIPSNNYSISPQLYDNVMRRRDPKEVMLHEYKILSFLSNWSPHVAAGFYWDGYGPLPFAFGVVPPEQYTVGLIVKEIQPGRYAPR